MSMFGCDSTKCHVKKVKCQMKKLVGHLKCDAYKISNEKVKAMFETSAETIKGLINALEDYQTKSEKAWK